jgi:hypothetical protein
MRTYSTFWIGYCLGLLCLSAAWRDRDELPAEPHSGDDLSMAEWLRLPETTRAAMVQQYTTRRPTVRYIDTEERRRQESAA